ncbi:MAG TPA: GH3 auxin-responsive promoter family protein [Ardenticatenaceae bacterium]
MSGLLQVAANTLWLLSSLPEHLAFRRALRDVEGTQRALLLRLLRRNADTEIGRRYGFGAIRSIAEYQARVPLSTYEDYREAVERIGVGEQGVLTVDPVLLMEPTSGSTAATKLIPYTATLKTEFQRAVSAWMVDLFLHDPRLLLGQAYWSISPVTRQGRYTAAGIPIGFEEDSEYLGGLQGALARALQAVPPLVRHISDMDAFRYTTLLFLLRSRSLALVSVWNPTFLTLLVGELGEWWPQLARDIAEGTFTPPGVVAPELRQQARALNRPNARRAEEIRQAFEAEGDAGSIHARIWPRLRLVSCWADGHAAHYLPDVARLFPQARVQPKGLIATEGFVSFPLVGHAGAVLALRSHFFEFLPVDDGVGAQHAVPLQAHEVEQGRSYSIVLTTGGGLYRYQLHDVVEVVGWRGGCPLVRFTGKEAHVSDHFGEKVNERHVRQVFDTLFAPYEVRPTFAMLACEEHGGRHAYTLFIEAPHLPDEGLHLLVMDIEAALQENFHYQYCRDLGQLDAVRLFRIREGALESYMAGCQAHGQRAGDIKPIALHRSGGWTGSFKGELLPETCRYGERR